MSKILIVLSAILVISLICAGNAGSETTLRDDCGESIEEVRAYINSVYRIIPRWMQTEDVHKKFTHIHEGVDHLEEVVDKTMKASGQFKAPSGRIIQCNDGIASFLIYRCQQIVGTFKSAFKEDHAFWGFPLPATASR